MTWGGGSTVVFYNLFQGPRGSWGRVAIREDTERSGRAAHAAILSNAAGYGARLTAGYLGPRSIGELVLMGAWRVE